MSVEKPIYKELKLTDNISVIPDVINSNSGITKNIFENIFNFDDSSQYIKTPVITNGLIKGSTGEFDNIKIKNISSDSSIAFNNIIVDHDKSINRFSSKLNNNIKNYSHDTDKICYVSYDNNSSILSTTSLTNKIEYIDAEISNISNNIATLDASLSKIDNIVNSLLNGDNNINNLYSQNLFNIEPINDVIDEELVNTINSKSNSYTYPAKTYANNDTDMIKYNSDKYDILNNNKFRYYIVDSNYIKINNQYNICLHTDVIGTNVNIIIDENNIYNNDLIIRLNYNGNTYECIKILKDDIKLARINLVCVDINEFGEKWYIKNYNGKIELINI